MWKFSRKTQESKLFLTSWHFNEYFLGAPSRPGCKNSRSFKFILKSLLRFQSALVSSRVSCEVARPGEGGDNTLHRLFKFCSQAYHVANTNMPREVSLIIVRRLHVFGFHYCVLLSTPDLRPVFDKYRNEDILDLPPANSIKTHFFHCDIVFTDYITVLKYNFHPMFLSVFLSSFSALM